MESRSVSHFLAVVDGGSFSAAARQLEISQQALSKSIARLEQRMGVRLFERTGHGANPTAFAYLYLPHARAMLVEAQRFRAQLRDALGGGKGTIRIGVGATAASGLVAAVVAELSRKHPSVRIAVITGLYEVMCDDLLAGRLDLVVANRLSEGCDSLIAEEILGDAIYIAVSGPDHPLAYRPEITFADLAGTSWVTGGHPGDVSQTILAAFKAQGIASPTVVVETTSILFTSSLLRVGTHVGILPIEVAAGEIAAGRLVKLDISAADWRRPLVMAYRPTSTWLPVLAELMAGLRAQVER